MSSFLTLAYIIPVVAGNEETHVDKPKKSTSFWIRTGLEIFLGAGFTWGVVEKIRNSRDINRLTQTIHGLSEGLTNKQQTELTALKALIENVYGDEYKKYLEITDKNVEYNVDAIIKLANENQLNLSQENFGPDNKDGIVKTYITTKSPKLEISLDTNYATVHTISKYDLCLSQLINLEHLYAVNVLNTELANTMEDKSEKLAQYEHGIGELLLDLQKTSLTDNQKSKLVYKYCIRKLMELANVKPTMEHYWNIVQANGQTIQNWKSRQTTPGEALLVLTCQSLFDGQVTEQTITPENLSGALCTKEFYALQSGTVTIDNKKQIKFKTKLKGQKYPKITNIDMKQITKNQLAQLFADKFLISELLFTLYNEPFKKNTTEQNKTNAKLALDELTLIYLASKFISSYTASKIPVLEKTNNTSLTKFIEQADKKWDLFEKFMEENQLSTVDFSKAKFEKRFVFGIVKEENK